MARQDDILSLALEVSRITGEKIETIELIMRQTNLLAINARIEAGRAGAAGAAFSVVAEEMGAVSTQITTVANELRSAVQQSMTHIERAGSELMLNLRGARFTDIALNAIEIIDRNLYERSCDVRWWATDSAVVQALQAPSAESAAFAGRRLATILRSYTVYLDLWIIDRTGRVVAGGNPLRYPNAVGTDVSGAPWFRDALGTRSGEDFVVADVERNPSLGNAPVATYATAIRRGGETDGRALGVLGILFDWRPQALAVVQGVGLTEDEKRRSRTLLLDSSCRILAASDDAGVLTSAFPLANKGQPRGFYIERDRLVAYALTPGYETYKGLGWYGVVEYQLDPTQTARAA